MKQWLYQWSNFTVKDGILGRKVFDPLFGNIFQILLPQCLRKNILVGCHDEWGHQGRNKTEQLARSRVYWPGMARDIEFYVKRYIKCAKAREMQPRVRTPMRHLMAFSPLEIIAIDFVKLDPGKGRFEDVLVITDVYTKLAQAIPCRNQHASTVAKALQEHWFTKYGIPNRIHSDQGRNFEGQVIKELCRLYDIRKTRTTPYHPEGNAQAERFNRTLFGLIKSLDQRDRRRWPELLPHLVYMYNTTPHETTRVSPFALMFGRKERIPLDHLLGVSDVEWEQDFVKEQAELVERAQKVVRERTDKVAARNKARADANISASPPPPGIGSLVYLKKCAFSKRHKLENVYYDELYVVAWVNPTKDIYRIRPINGGHSKIVNRRLIREVPSEPDVVDQNREDFGLNFGERRKTNVSYKDSRQDFDDEYVLVPERVTTETVGESTGRTRGGTSEGVVQRRSQRQSKGIHSNPYNLPRSVLR